MVKGCTTCYGFPGPSDTVRSTQFGQQHFVQTVSNARFLPGVQPRLPQINATALLKNHTQHLTIRHPLAAQFPQATLLRMDIERQLANARRSACLTLERAIRLGQLLEPTIARSEAEGS